MSPCTAEPPIALRASAFRECRQPELQGPIHTSVLDHRLLTPCFQRSVEPAPRTRDPHVVEA